MACGLLRQVLKTKEVIWAPSLVVCRNLLDSLLLMPVMPMVHSELFQIAFFGFALSWNALLGLYMIGRALRDFKAETGAARAARRGKKNRSGSEAERWSASPFRGDHTGEKNGGRDSIEC